MKKGTNKVLVLAGLAAGAYAIVKLTSVVDTAQSLQIQLLKLNIKLPKVFATIQIFNPSKNTITIDSLVGEIFFNGKSIGTLQYINKTPIAPYSYTNFNDVLINLSPSGVITLTVDIIQKKSDGTITIKGKVYVKGKPLPFEQSKKVM